MFGNIKNASGENLDYTFHAGDKSSQHIVVLGHGVTGNKDRPFLVELADNLSNAGIPTIRFSFSGNGNSDGEFTQSTISKEIGDLVHPHPTISEVLKESSLGALGSAIHI